MATGPAGPAWNTYDEPDFIERMIAAQYPRRVPRDGKIKIVVDGRSSPSSMFARVDSRSTRVADVQVEQEAGSECATNMSSQDSDDSMPSLIHETSHSSSSSSSSTSSSSDASFDTKAHSPPELELLFDPNTGEAFEEEEEQDQEERQINVEPRECVFCFRGCDKMCNSAREWANCSIWHLRHELKIDLSNKLVQSLAPKLPPVRDPEEAWRAFLNYQWNTENRAKTLFGAKDVDTRFMQFLARKKILTNAEFHVLMKDPFDTKSMPETETARAFERKVIKERGTRSVAIHRA